MTKLVIRGRTIRSDERGLVCLTDIWKASQRGDNYKPGQWQSHDVTKKLMLALIDRIVAQNHNSRKISVKSIYYSKGAAGTYADPRLALALAAESLANERIEETDPQGPTRCQIAVRTSATFIREAIEKDRASRGKPLFG